MPDALFIECVGNQVMTHVIDIGTAFQTPLITEAWSTYRGKTPTLLLCVVDAKQ